MGLNGENLTRSSPRTWGWTQVFIIRPRRSVKIGFKVDAAGGKAGIKVIQPRLP